MKGSFRRLVFHLASMKAVPKGGCFADGMAALQGDNLSRILQESEKEANGMIDLVISSPDNPFGVDREAIAAEIMKRVSLSQEEMSNGKTR